MEDQCNAAAYFTSSSSTSKISAELAGMPGMARVP
jgi:hypothetical protein